MKNWLKKQATEMTAVAGFLVIVCAFLTPRWVLVTIGVVLIAIDDEKAKAFIADISPKVSKWIDSWGTKQ